MAVESSVLSGVEPAAFWHRFEELTRIARPSRHEELVIEWVERWADGHGFERRSDSARNMVVRVPATAGREGAPAVVLQGHLDMVCERDPASPNDPAEGRIALLRDGEWLTADGTTLGADDGVAIAAMMTLAEDPSLPHGPLELLMTVAEEVGLEGANGLDPALLTGRTLLNLDSEEDGTLTVGCAGSTDTWIRLDGERAAAAPGSVALAVTAGGGLGGHSGTNIDDGRANAIKVLASALREARQVAAFRLDSLTGGKSRNAIPRDAHAVCSVAAADETAFRAAVAAAADRLRGAFAVSDPAIRLTVAGADPAPQPWSEEATARLLDAVALVPSGPLAMSPDVPGLVETSSSLGEAVTESGSLTLHSLSRSSNDAYLPEVVAGLDAVARRAGGRFEVKHNYPGWRPDMASPLLASARRVFTRLFEREPVVVGIHAGLETAVIGDKVPGLDMLAIGPQIEFPHSPDERVSVPTVERFWRLLLGILDDLSTPGRPA
jgi:dipeptidase D